MVDLIRTRFVLTESTISDPWHSFDPRPSPGRFSPRLRDKIWEGPGNEATDIICTCKSERLRQLEIVYDCCINQSYYCAVVHWRSGSQSMKAMLCDKNICLNIFLNCQNSCNKTCENLALYGMCSFMVCMLWENYLRWQGASRLDSIFIHEPFTFKLQRSRASIMAQAQVAA